jgi:hypothetical protein
LDGATSAIPTDNVPRGTFPQHELCAVLCTRPGTGGSGSPESPLRGRQRPGTAESDCREHPGTMARRVEYDTPGMKCRWGRGNESFVALRPTRATLPAPPDEPGTQAPHPFTKTNTTAERTEPRNRSPSGRNLPPHRPAPPTPSGSSTRIGDPVSGPLPHRPCPKVGTPHPYREPPSEHLHPDQPDPFNPEAGDSRQFPSRRYLQLPSVSRPRKRPRPQVVRDRRSRAFGRNSPPGKEGQ